MKHGMLLYKTDGCFQVLKTLLKDEVIGRARISSEVCA